MQEAYGIKTNRSLIPDSRDNIIQLFNQRGSLDSNRIFLLLKIQIAFEPCKMLSSNVVFAVSTNTKNRDTMLRIRTSTRQYCQRKIYKGRIIIEIGFFAKKKNRETNRCRVLCWHREIIHNSVIPNSSSIMKNERFSKTRYLYAVSLSSIYI